jgi:hypothetical protein
MLTTGMLGATHSPGYGQQAHVARAIWEIHPVVKIEATP